MKRRTRASWLVIGSILVLAPALALAYSGPEGQEEYDNYGLVELRADHFEPGPGERPPGPITDGPQTPGGDGLSSALKPGSRVLGGAPLTATGGSDGASQSDTIQVNLKRLAKRLR